MRSVSPLSFLVVVSFVAVALSGCLGGDDAVTPEGSARVHIRTTYDATLRHSADDAAAEERHRSVDLPPGTPARDLVFQVVVRALDGVTYTGWEGDAECKPGFINRATNERRPADCSATDGQAEIVVPPPPADGSAARHNYRFDGSGERVLVFPQPVLAGFRLLVVYSDPLLQERADPSGCPDLQSYARGEHSTLGGALSNDGFYIRVNGSGTVDMPFYGFCQTGE